MLMKRAPPRVFVLPPVFLKIFDQLSENRRKPPSCLVTCYARTEGAQNRLKIDFLTEKNRFFPAFFSRKDVDRSIVTPKLRRPFAPLVVDE